MTQERKTKGGPDAIDIHVGSRLRVGRVERGLSQEKFAERMGLTFQQIQKYERGTNRIAAGRLYMAAKILEKPIDYFYPGSSEEALPECISAIEALLIENRKLKSQLKKIARIVPVDQLGVGA